MLKECFKCKRTLPLTDFYAHPAMSDGRLGKCKECAKADVKANREARREQYAEYEQERFKTPKRKRQVAESQRRRRKRNPEKDRARRLLWQAIIAGKVIRPTKCQQCGRACEPEAHHWDYYKPLDVLWWCFKCHREVGHGQVVINENFTRTPRNANDANNATHP